MLFYSKKLVAESGITVMVYGMLVVVAMLLFGCARAESASDTTEWLIATEGQFPDANPLAVKGNIQISGSSTVFPLVEALANRFRDEGYGHNLTIDSIGSGAGFERFCVAGESDISNASRPIQEPEIASCKAIGRNPIQIRVGTDALVVAVHHENDWVQDISLAQLAQIFTAIHWSDVVSTWPDKPIERFVPGTDSGTFDYFIEEIFDKDNEPILSAPTTQFSEDDNVLVRGISGSKNAIGFFGFAYYINDPRKIRALSIDGIAPDYDSVNDGAYALARPLFMYSDVAIIRERPQVGAFLIFMLNYANEEIKEVGYFPMNGDDTSYAQDTLMDALRSAGILDG